MSPRYHPDAVPKAADPAASKFDWVSDTRPQASMRIPEGHLLIQMMNAHPTSAGNCIPGQVVALPDDEARAFIRQGYAREVRKVRGAGIPPFPYEDPRQIYEAERTGR